ncbi:hypothetical protein SAMN04487859_108117 [Roseovarius lutimaris]|uniref:Uncharacterized protein n=1 Tax=Roseovarius lutimaris TaxID=1005928 RepID=A0A1I5BNU7_9RHOB|nr:hypothetical protein [Roseovarius lutimaris]SFN76337.1 hypothetical protein SAMN04487859_108117 [Roseovarius lutimaris]
METITSDILTGLGLAITLAGAWITARAVILKEADAINIGLSRVVGGTNEEKLQLPMVQNLLASSRGARRGLLFIAGGTALQIVPIAIRLILRALA